MRTPIMTVAEGDEHEFLANDIVAPFQGADDGNTVTEGFAEAAAPSAIMFVTFGDLNG